MSCTTGCPGCGVCAEPTTPAASTCPTVSFCAGNYSVTYSGGCITKEKRSNAIPDGTYVNPTITVVDGCVTAMTGGTPSVTVLSNPCGTSETVTPTGVTVNPDACNLLSNTPTGLLVKPTFFVDSPLNLSGCGTLSNPWDLTLNTTQLLQEAGGVSASGCGIGIANGLVTQWTKPLMGITSTSSAVTVTTDPATCQAVIDVNVAYGGVAYVRPLCCTSTAGSAGPVSYLVGMASVIRSGSGAIVSLCWTNVPPSYSPPPTVFPTVQDAINWVDSFSYTSATCPPTAESP